MIKKLLVLTLFLSSHVVANTDCRAIDEKAQEKAIRFDSTDNGYTVTGKERSYFYTAPNEGCIKKQVFIIPGDKVNAYLDYNEYYYVMYFKKNGQQVEGWVKQNQLKSNNTGVAPK
ncbi:hypothetical protein HC231_08110 [Brenneria izadpanahii]|uniref:SH3 domain-containing protein n=1 Tax=Brenneria izadpanahii TaxID=2722756 RepID=A0ABX7UQM4_9GAMM|nr:hypothetical protein [Brenneria izadpanahii]QTF07899.1 hypothetical protein HC231_08110 [Brenneria izadpanahii]